ncbi:sensor histidine kinase [Phototrophicus methaneseepsis]|uniref:sensor histidine kinase n=1 Tax=Phototrophicus methaneseepsis TaxID=2710758 RepID=UPI001E5575D4|nr:HAMP domain-containing sensor histidine kinase [Phototrophicus methaneseepsis]
MASLLISGGDAGRKFITLSVTSQILLVSEHIAQAEQITLYLQQHDFDVVVVDTFEELPNFQTADAVIGVPTPETFLLYSDLMALEVRPLLVWITDQYANLLGHIADVADAILPNHPLYIERQLSLLLNWRAELNKSNTADEPHGSETELLKNAIVRNVSHELRTPFLQVKSAVSLIAEEAKNESLVTYASNALSRLESIIQNITMLGSSLEYNPAPIILRDTVEGARRNLQRSNGNIASDDRIKLLIDDKLPPVMADRQGLTTVMRLLIENALKFSKEQVEIIARQEGGRAFIAVQDYGIGIPENKLKNIFELFYQIDGSTTRRYGGTGIGLALVKLILELHQSKIYVQSIPGQGSIFYFFLSLVDMDDNALVS